MKPMNHTFLKFNIKTRTRYGYVYVGFSKYNDSLIDAEVVFAFVESLKTIQAFKFIGGETLSISPEQYSNQTVDTTSGTNYFPLGKYYNDFNLYLLFDNSVVKFDNNTWIHVTTVYDYSNPSPTSFKTEFDERSSIQIVNITAMDYGYSPPTPSLETYHYGAYIFVMICLITTFVALILFSKKQPLKSRGLIPYISCVLHFIFLCGNVTFFFFTFEDYRYFCTILFLTQYTPILTLMALTMGHFIRYLLIVNHQHGKDVFIQDKNNGEFDVKLKWKMIKFLGKGYVQLILLFFIFFCIALTFVFGFTVDQFTCSRSYLWVGIYFITLVGFFTILIIVCLIFDLIVNITKSKSCSFLWKEDVYYYRTELIVTLILASPLFVLSKVLNPDFIVTYRKFSFFTLEKPNILFAAIVNSLGMWIIFFSLSALPLILTIVKELFLCYKPQSKKPKLLEALNDKDARELFYQFSKSEWSIENLSAWEDIELYIKEKDFQKRKERATQIYYLYLNGNESRLELNIQSKICKEVFEHIQKAQFDDTLFQKINEVIYDNMCDTFARFEMSRDYVLHKKKTEFFGGYKRIPQE